ncbi:hypothetical protein A9K55_003946 [Cordyceps militaris]|uniref:Uncharacterized protein n=1 Tax=Cordyceps militaris TaxID=73501 RepID=A0A2H4SL67_CORMI|nr:hypothetical protein A9K55_003946 [Cordyceps militaris]
MFNACLMPDHEFLSVRISAHRTHGRIPTASPCGASIVPYRYLQWSLVGGTGNRSCTDRWPPQARNNDEKSANKALPHQQPIPAFQYIKSYIAAGGNVGNSPSKGMLLVLGIVSVVTGTPYFPRESASVLVYPLYACLVVKEHGRVCLFFLSFGLEPLPLSPDLTTQYTQLSKWKTPNSWQSSARTPVWTTNILARLRGG